MINKREIITDDMDDIEHDTTISSQWLEQFSIEEMKEMQDYFNKVNKQRNN